MRILKNIFGKSDKIHTDNIADGTGRLLSNSVIVERGSSANGQWIKFGDGTMICYQIKAYGPASTQSGAVFVSSNFEWIFPQIFNEIPSVSSSVVYGWGSSWTVGSSSDTNASRFSFRIASLFNANTYDIGISMIAIGRWK